MWWKKPVTEIKGIGAKKAAALAKLGVLTVGDLLEFYPRQDAYLDYSCLKSIKELATDGSKQVFKGEVYSVKNGYSARGLSYTAVLVRDNTGYAYLYFFASQRFAARTLKNGAELLITGKVTSGKNSKIVSEVQFRAAEKEQAAPGILPVYPINSDLSQLLLRKWVSEALKIAEENLQESLPEAIISKEGLLGRYEALKNIHFPDSFALLKAARRRLGFEELFLLQCGIFYFKKMNYANKQGIKHLPDGKLAGNFVKGLPFTLTDTQVNAWREIAADMQGEKPMHRLLQGDVGSGKTVIGALALVKAVESGYQGCLMAPTEILAVQHYSTLKAWFEPLGVKVALLTGGMHASERSALLAQILTGLIDIVVGTHALLEEDVRFRCLSVAITDEQHRFGVNQRAKLANKSGSNIDMLVMTATPIPRTLALTVYGDLDISVLKGKPAGRKAIITLCYTDDRRSEVYQGLARQVQAGYQAYVVCPLIAETEALAAKSAEQVYQELTSTFLRGYVCAFLHGRLPNKEKEKIMAAFARGEIRVLVSTTVIEVGINVPNATLMIIENAERFGLAQLHQLRGRVGRGGQQSYCVLLTPKDSPEALARLGVMRESSDGFYLAEKDLAFRGSGQFFGTRQHGLPDLRIADIMRDTNELARVRLLAENYIESEENCHDIRKLLDRQFGDRFAMIFNI